MTIKVMVTILSLFADIERNYILKRTQASRIKYIESGRKLERTPKINKSKTELILELLEQGKTKQEITDFLNVDRTTISHTLKRNGY